MQLREVAQPEIGDTPQVVGDLPLKIQNSYTVIRDSQNTYDRTKEYHYNGRTLRHRCPLKNCGHRHLPPRCSSTPGVYGQDYAGSGGGVKTRRHPLHHQPARTPPVPLTNLDHDGSTTPEGHYPSQPASPDPLALSSRGLPAPSQPQSCRTAVAVPITTTIPLDHRRKAVQYIIKQLKVEGNRNTRTVQEIQQRIINLEQQIFHTITSQEEYVIKLASKLAAILEQLNQCQPSPSCPPSCSTQPAPSRPLLHQQRLTHQDAHPTLHQSHQDAHPTLHQSHHPSSIYIHLENGVRWLSSVGAPPTKLASREAV